MTKSLKGLLVVNTVLLVWNLLSATGNAQRPPRTDPEGIPFLAVNINPSDVPPMVNINPNQLVPKVEITRMPEVRLTELRIPATGCSDPRNFQTAVGRSISGPLLVTYLNLTQSGQATLSTAQGESQRVTLGNATPLATAIYLRVGQRLTFEADILYSGCQPD